MSAVEKETPLGAMIAGLSMPAKGWSRGAREDASARLHSMGLPTRRDEYWKYTRPDTLVQACAPEAAMLQGEEEPIYENIDRVKIVFVDGVFDADASDDLAGETHALVCSNMSNNRL